MVSTIASLIRDNGNAIRALATSMSQDGKKYLYKDILVTLGLPVTPGHIRALSKFLNKEGIRRRDPFTRKRSDHPEIPALIQDEHASIGDVLLNPLPIERDPVTAMLADCGKLNEISRALNQISEGMRAVAEACGLYILTETVVTHNPGTATDD